MKSLFVSLILLFQSTLFAFIGGQVAKKGQFSFIAMIEYNCTTSIIAANKLLLAAHCVNLIKGDNSLYVGQEIMLYTSPVVVGSQPTRIKIKKIDVHPWWQEKINQGLHASAFMFSNETSDLAIITLEENIKTSPSVQVISFDFQALKIKQPVYAGGYGCEEREVPSRNPKYKFALKPVKSFRGNFVFLDTTNLKPKGSSMACEGDSGGPVFILKNKKYYIVGVNSRVWGDKEKDGRLSFVNIAKHKDWIIKILADNY
ncbi:MAG: trypsin-like serine protease [Bdellovibrionota bacterium]